ncbi:MAG TPA: response regulator transcription factor [Candidatus Enterocloster excrementigallinarum]|uniref:Stage 0 sporulation protein A homolog n=1 Tax=Candidatus Enterocloster excrementigallinarum TaxID=2838558 RepID=A0A9D2TEK9_9FIRM|nr:response regulator transcription factor [Candidatus Enterocloster excrementigallinarum]
MRLLIVDDDLHLRKLVRTYAQMEQFQCEEAVNGQEALKLLAAHPFDMVVLDVMMPGLSGFETLSQIRKTSQVPVIMLTARSEEYDKLLGFKLGVDDYVSKPFSPKELMARIGAVLKRSNSPNPNRTLDFGELSISPESRTVILRGQNIALPPKEFDLLLKLAQNERIVLSREQLLETIWGYSYCGDSRTVDTHVKSLRDHLGDYRNVIQTVWGVGYKFEYGKK